MIGLASGEIFKVENATGLKTLIFPLASNLYS